MIAVLAVVWSLCALFGLGVNIYALRDALADRYFVQHWTHRGTRLIVANANIRRERLRGAVQLVFFVIGLAAISSPPPCAEGRPMRGFISLGFMVVALLTVWASLADRYDRKRLLKEIASQERP